MPKVELKRYSDIDEPFLGVWSLCLFDEALESALDVFEVLKCADRDGSARQHAAISLFPTGLSIAHSVRELLRQAYLPSARILLRPLMERVAALDYVVNQADGPDLWERGWAPKHRPSLPKLIQAMVAANTNDAANIARMVKDFHALVHAGRDDSELFLSPDEDGNLGYSPAQTPWDFERAESIGAAGMFAVTMLESDARRAMLGWPPLHAKP